MTGAALRPALVEHFVDGRRIESDAQRWGPVYDPALGSVSRHVPFAEVADVERAVTSAARAFEEWSATTPLRRARVLFAYRQLLEAHADELARIITKEHGKTLPDARGEVSRGIDVVEFACGIPHLLKGEFSEAVGPRMDSWSVRQPLGVCAGVTPFNFPAMVPLWMFPLAVACGNTFVLKPSERDPSASVRLAELLFEAGAPAGVLNVVHGDRTAVESLVADPRVEAVSFVGSSAIARLIYTNGARLGKRVQALGGAKNHAVVLEDADLDGAVEALLGAGYGSAGERCMAVSVVVAVGAVGDALVTALARGAQALRVGAGGDDGVEMGPLVTAEHRERVIGYIERGLAEGATLAADGRAMPVPDHGFFLGATVFDHVTPGMTIHREEIFGPVLSVVRVPNLEAAVEVVNAHPYANGVAIFTRSGGSARDFAQRIRVGMVGINVAIPVPMAYHSFGGWKQSMFGDRAIYGTEGVHFYTRLKTVTARWPGDAEGRTGFSIPAH